MKKPSDAALLTARRLTPHQRQAMREAFEHTPPTDPIWTETGYWPSFRPTELDAALKWLNK